MQETQTFTQSKPIEPEAAAVMPADQLSRLLYRLVDEYSRRQGDALKLYIPLVQTKSFHQGSSYQRLLTGSNRAGKTLGGAAEIARIVRGMDPHASHKGLPERDGRVLVVGKDGDHLADPIWKSLAFPGAFQMIADKDTGVLRSVRPDPNDPSQLDPYDESERPISLGGKKRRGGWKPAPALIPPSAIKKVVWENAGLNIPRKVILNTGWEIMFYSSNSAPRLGISVDVVWFDEEIERAIWYGESLARLVDRNGLFIWTCTPQASTPQLYELHVQAKMGATDIKETRITIDRNPYHTALAKKRLHDALMPEERAVRYYGEYAIAGRKVYPSFDLHGVHGVESFEIPDDWMRIAAVDPGFQRLAVLFMAINPEATEAHCFDEIYMAQATSKKFAEAMKIKVGTSRFETFIIDWHMGRQSNMTSGLTVERHYREALQEAGVASARKGYGFEWGSDDTRGRTEAVLEWMRDNEEGQSILRVHRENCPNLVNEIQSQYYKKDQPDKRDPRQASHLVDCLEYLAAHFRHGLYYREPPMEIAEDYAQRKHKNMKKLLASWKKRKNQDGDAISLGPIS